jgi:hypothetical protein
VKGATVRVLDSVKVTDAPILSLRKTLGLAKSNVKYLMEAIAKVRRQEKRLGKIDTGSCTVA